MIKSIITNLKELKHPCNLVTKEDDYKTIIQDLRDTLESKKCLGLTVNQIGYNKRISYIKIPKFVDKNKHVIYQETILINAKIIEQDKPIKVNNELCVSFPNINVITKRYVYCIVEYLDENLKPQLKNLQDWESICCQHEIDHQNGITLFDRKWKAK